MCFSHFIVSGGGGKVSYRIPKGNISGIGNSYQKDTPPASVTFLKSSGLVWFIDL